MSVQNIPDLNNLTSLCKIVKDKLYNNLKKIHSPIEILNETADFDFINYYDPTSKICIDNPKIIIFEFITKNLYLNYYDTNIIKQHDITTKKIILTPKIINNKFLNNYINPNFYALHILKKIRILKRILGKKNLDISETFVFNKIIAEFYYRIKNYVKSIEYYENSRTIYLEIVKKRLVHHCQTITNKLHDNYYIYTNSKTINNIVYNIAIIYIKYLHNNYDEAATHLIYASKRNHNKSTRLLCVLLLKYYYIFSHNMLQLIMLHMNNMIYTIITEPTKLHYNEHYNIGFLYSLINEAPYTNLGIQHFKKSAEHYGCANYELGNLCSTKGNNYNIFKSLTYYNNAKKYKHNVKFALKYCKIMLKNDLINKKRSE
jgi:tetratricopeptide (TPR) repeat protein